NLRSYHKQIDYLCPNERYPATDPGPDSGRASVFRKVLSECNEKRRWLIGSRNALYAQNQG
ncbi:MAG: hypothetical protein AB8F95_21305, partial [Bacteroidia bacterium]